VLGAPVKMLGAPSNRQIQVLSFESNNKKIFVFNFYKVKKIKFIRKIFHILIKSPTHNPLI